MLGVTKMTHNQIYYISDVHFEFIISSKGICQEKLEQYRKFFTPQPHQVQPNHKQILLIAGDLITSRHFHYIADFMTSLPYDNILYVLGNHEYYGDDFQKAQARIQNVIDKNEILKEKMVILENDFVQFNGLKIIGTSYWYSVPFDKEFMITQRLNDYKKISNHYKKIHYPAFSNKNREAKEFIWNVLDKNNNDKVLLVTHHAISERHLLDSFPYPDCYGFGTLLHFSEEQQNRLIGNIHGHSHFSEPHSYHNEYGIPVYTNTLGYIDNEFDLNKYRELPFICT